MFRGLQDTTGIVKDSDIGSVVSTTRANIPKVRKIYREAEVALPVAL